MNDAEYLFRQTSKERAVVARGDKHKKRQGGRYVRLPSDHLTRKEREALNGKILTFDPKKFYSWEEFKALPDDLQLRYVNSIINRYEVGVSTVSKVVFGKSETALHEYMKRKDLAQYVTKTSTGGVGGTKRRLALIAAMEAARNPAANAETPAEAPQTPPVEFSTPTPCDNTPDDKEPAPFQEINETDIYRFAELLSSLRGTGAKLTIEVTL